MVSLLLAIIYLSFISLGLPDALLGAAWPSMYPIFQVPMSYAGIISMIISLGTVASSLQSDRLTKKFGTGKVTVVSVGMTAVALLGFSLSNSFWMLCLWAIPYGLGAGSVDASLNNYVALHYASRHMSWLHCMWGIGISIGPYIMSYALTRGMSWNMGYRYIFYIQVVLTLVLVFSLPMWKKPANNISLQAETTENPQDTEKVLTLTEIIRIPGAKEIMGTFFCYCALEQTAILWGCSYLVMVGGMHEERAASFASLFCIGITVGRAISGFLTMKINDENMVRLGQVIILLGILSIFLPLGQPAIMVGLMLVGLGCAPIYPCAIHATPKYFGADKSQAIIGVQMASAYVGTSFMPPLFGFVANHISMKLFPVYLLLLLLVMYLVHEKLQRITAKE